MSLSHLSDFLASPPKDLGKTPVALVFDEDGVALAETVAHCLKLGFGAVLVFSPGFTPEEQQPLVYPIAGPRLAPEQVFEAVTLVAEALPGAWLHYCYNAEFLHFPFCETRSVAELLAFHAEERREAMLTYTVDLYAGDLEAAPNAVDLEACYLDRSGYFAEQCRNSEGQVQERQWKFRGGLRWRFEEHIPKAKRHSGRSALFRAKPGLVLHPDHTLSEAEMNTVSCPWHHNLTAAICSFRVAKALRANPGSREAIASFHWPNSTRFEWSSQQLMDLGLIEPGQWF